MNNGYSLGEIIAIVKEYERSVGISTEGKWTIKVGRGRFYKVTCEQINSRRAVAFYNPVTNSIFKAASWSQPARTRIA